MIAPEIHRSITITEDIGNLKIASDGTVSVDVEDVATPDGKYYNWGMYAGEVHGEAFMKGDVYFIGYEHLNELYEDKVQQGMTDISVPQR